MKSIKIQGNDYIMVNERVKFFRENYKNWSMESEILKVDGAVCIIKATIKDEKGVVVATGHACEKSNSSFINKTSYIENCETSAWGRALANLGIGIDTSMASAEEVCNAILNQAASEGKTVDEWIDAVKDADTVEQLNKLFGRWVREYPKGTEGYKTISKASGDRKLAIQNPDLKVEIRG